jgi:gas vesicle protein
MKTAKVIISVAAAAAAGVAIGMLIAPEKGEELQKKITDGARSWFGELLALIGTAKTASDENRSESSDDSNHELEESNINNERA